MIRNRFEVFIYYLIMLGVLALDPYKTHKSHILFWVFAFLIPTTLIVMKKRGIGNLDIVKIATFLIVIVTMAAFVIIGAWHSFYAESVFDDLREDFSKRPASLLEKTYEAEDKENIADIFRIYYFKGHKVLFHLKDADITNDVLEKHKEYMGSDSIQGIDSLTEADAKAEACLSFPYYEVGETGEKYVYVVDDYLKNNADLACFVVDGKVYFCSEEQYESGDYCGRDIENRSKEAFYILAEESYNLRLRGFTISNRIIQIVAIMILSILGALITLPLWGERYPFVAVVLSLPIGAVIWSAIGTLITSLGLRITIGSMALFFICLFLPFFLLYREHYRKVKFKSVVMWSLPYFVSIVYFSYLGVILTSSDSLCKCKYGLKLAIGGISNYQYTDMASFGMIEPYIHALGYMLGGDFVYAVYPLFYVIAITVLIYGIVVLVSRISFGEGKSIITALSALGVFVLLINSDYRYGAFFVLSHDIVTMYFLIIFVFLILRSEDGFEHYGVILSLASLAIIITRVEGIIYALFLLTVIVGYCGGDVYIRRTGIVICAISFMWIFIQLLHFDGDSASYFFTPSKAVILTGGTIVCAAGLLLYDKFLLIKAFLNDDRYPYAYVALLAIVTTAFAVFYNPSMALKNIPIYFSHLSSYLEYGNNSGYLWVFVVLSLGALTVINNDVGKLMYNTVMGYLLLIFLIFIFRKDIEIHVWWWDSGRRVLVHMMPTAIWLVIASFYESIKDKADEQSGEEKVKCLL